MKFEVFQSEKSKKYYFRLKAGNGEVVLSSEAYNSKDSAKKGAESVQTNAKNDERYEVKEASNGKFHFNLKAGNHQVVGSSQMYTTRDGAKKGIEAVKRAADGADIIDVK